MKEEIIKPIVFFVLIVVIVFSMIGTWSVITIDIQKDEEYINPIIPESKTGAGYVSINIVNSENQEDE